MTYILHNHVDFELLLDYTNVNELKGGDQIILKWKIH